MRIASSTVNVLGTFSDNIDFCESQFTGVAVQVHNPWFCIFFGQDCTSINHARLGNPVILSNIKVHDMARTAAAN